MSDRARASLAYVALFIAIGASAPYLVLYYQSLGLALGEIGLIVSLGALLSLGASPAWGALSDRLRGSPVVLLAACAIAVAGGVLLAVARDALGATAGAVVFGIGMAGASPIIDARALEAVGGDRSGYGPLRAWGSAAYIAGSFLTGAAVERWGITVAIAATIAFMALTGAVAVTIRPRFRPVRAPSFRSVVPLFGPRGLGLFLLGALLTWTSVATLMAFFSIQIVDLGAGESVVGISSAVGAAVEVPIMLAFPALIARFGVPRLLIAGAAIFTVRAVLSAVTTDPAVLVVASGIGGVGYALFLVSGVTYVSTHVPQELAATAQGVYQGLGVSPAYITAGVMGGAIAGAVGIAGLFAVLALLGVVATGIVALAVLRPLRGAVRVAAGPT